MDRKQAKKKVRHHKKRLKFYQDKLEKLEAEEKRIGFKYSNRK